LGTHGGQSVEGASGLRLLTEENKARTVVGKFLENVCPALTMSLVYTLSGSCARAFGAEREQ
jgi:hypothetical protein